MAVSEVQQKTLPFSRSNRPNALAEIQYGSIVASEPGTPSEEEDHEDLPIYTREDAEKAIGVSIGQEQLRLTSPKTPAAEKAAAMDDLDGGALFDSALLNAGPDSSEPSPEKMETTEEPASYFEHPVENTVNHSVATKEEDIPNYPRMPSPWRAQPRKFTRLEATRNTLRDSFAGGRRRAHSSSGMTAEAFKKLMASLPSMPKSSAMLQFSLPNFSNNDKPIEANGYMARPIYPRHTQSGTNDLPQNDGSSGSKVRHDLQVSPTQSVTTITGPSAMQSLDQIAASDYAALDRTNFPQPQRPPLKTLPSQLRKSASHDSLLLHRTLSRASSLGDDARFVNVSDQVNSRFKAIKDSLQDANFRLPSIPSKTTFTNFDFSDSVSNFFSEKKNIRSPEPNANVSFGSTASRSPRTSFKRGSLNSSSGPTSSSGMDPAFSATHPHFTRALERLSGDVVVMGGYRGSILRSAEPPHRQLWVPIKVGLNIRKVDLEVGLQPEDEESMEERIIPSGMLKNIGPVDISRRLFKRLRHSENAKSGSLRVHDYGYDWRLSPLLLSRKLIEFLESLPCNQPGVSSAERGATVIAHSLGGLITRHAVNQRPELFAGVVYAGVPTRCVNILGPFRNGDDVLFSSRVLTAQVNFSIRTSFALLPLDGQCFIDKKTKERYDVDFFDVNNWIDYRFSPCIAPPLPALNAAPQTTISGMISSMASMLNELPNPLTSRKNSMPKSHPDGPPSETKEHLASAVHTAEAQAKSGGANNFEPQMGGKGSPPPTSNFPPAAAHAQHMRQSSGNVSTACTIPYAKAVAYLTRVLAETKRFKLELEHQVAHTVANAYPPISIIYGKSTPTVYGAKVDGRDGIRRASAYDELAFASGDGVVLAKAAQLPDGYEVVRGGVVSSERGHVTLLGDLEAVGRCLERVTQARRKGNVGLGFVSAKS